MYSPRSFPYLHPPVYPSEKTASKPAPNRSAIRLAKTDTPMQTHHTAKQYQGLDKENRRPMHPLSVNMPPHSQPVVIPSRTALRSATATQSRATNHNGGRSARPSRNHNPNAIAPAVAALLAVTAIPKMPPRRPRRPAAMERTISMDELIQEWKQEDPDVPSLYGGSPLDILLGRVDESESEYGSLVSLEQENESSLTSRSNSSESIATMPPSLDFDDPSFVSSDWDNLSTPESLGRRSLTERRERAFSSPPKEDCVLDHPLLHTSLEESVDMLASAQATELASNPSPPGERFRSFKSNLTASIQALKSAAKSFSNFSAPSVPPDDLLTRSLLSPSYTSEMRPKHLEGLPSPELRRYLNPHSAPISPTELSMHLHDAFRLDADADAQAPMIQMQTYERRSRSQKNRRSRAPTSDPFSEAGRASAVEPTVRQREPRENSDFLRVIVLEMNMRRMGKLDSKAVGKARIWLPPRKLVSGKSFNSSTTNGVPDRWVGVAVD